VTVKASTLLNSDVLWQRFVARITAPPPAGLIMACSQIKYDLLKATLFGAGHKNRIANINGQTRPSLLSGFLQQHNRLPTDKDVALYTASYWFAVIPGYFNSGEDAVMTECAVEFLKMDE